MIEYDLPLKETYEPTRLGRYGNIRQDVSYPPIEFQLVYDAWARGRKHDREHEWDTYCDIRDSVPRGTNKRIRRKRMESRVH